MADRQPEFSPTQKAAGVLSAASLAIAMIAGFEGQRNVTYRDIVGVPTYCYGNTDGAVMGKTYTDEQCMDFLVKAVVQHGTEISHCLTRELPPTTLASFISLAYNVGSRAFCSSTLARKANAGDVRGACDELPKWVIAGGRRVNGLVKRRAIERAYCLKGLS